MRATAVKGVVGIPTRWVVERTFGWLNRDRRLRQDDELLPATSQAVIQVSMMHVMVRRLASIASYYSTVVICHARTCMLPLDQAEYADRDEGGCDGVADSCPGSCGHCPRERLPRPV
jgi:hypothetical protein